MKMVLLIKIAIVLAIISLLKIMIWQQAKNSTFLNLVMAEFGSREVRKFNISALIAMGLGTCIATFFPTSVGLLIGGVLGLIGCFIIM